MHTTLGVALLGHGERAAARSHLLRAREIHEKALGADHPRTINTRVAMADLLLEEGHTAEALAEYQGAAAITEKAFGPTNALVGPPLIGVGRCQLALGATADAVATLRRAVELNSGADPMDEGGAAFALAQALAAAGNDASKVEPLITRAREAFGQSGRYGEKRRAEVDAWWASQRK
jgi:hypothetical protein